MVAGYRDQDREEKNELNNGADHVIWRNLTCCYSRDCIDDLYGCFFGTKEKNDHEPFKSILEMNIKDKGSDRRDL